MVGKHRKRKKKLKFNKTEREGLAIEEQKNRIKFRPIGKRTARHKHCSFSQDHIIEDYCVLERFLNYRGQ